MPKCIDCGHPHGWYDGRCAACASKADIKPESEVEIVSGAPEGETGETSSDTTAETVVEEVVEPEPEPKKRGRTQRKTGGE